MCFPCMPDYLLFMGTGIGEKEQYPSPQESLVVKIYNGQLTDHGFGLARKWLLK